MTPAHILVLLVGGGLLALTAFACLRLLKSAQGLEDTEDERLWQYLLHPGRS